MRIRIAEVSDGASPQVRFSSAIGHATAVWRGGAPPRAGEQDVELEVPDSLRWGRDLRERPGAATGRMLEFDSPVLELYPTGI
jgi:hypothetical protein